MTKKISIIFIMLIFINTNVYAGNIPESIMSGKQKALFIGKIIDINTDIYSIILIMNLSSNIPKS